MQGGVCPEGSAWGEGVYPRYPMCTGADTPLPPPVDKVTDACENITFAAATLRTVKTTANNRKKYKCTNPEIELN